MSDGIGTDLALTRFFAADEWGAHDLSSAPSRRGRRLVESAAAEPHDLVTLSGRENLAQAVILRLLTPVGALAGFGHSAYGSRLGELIGRELDTATRVLARRFVLEAMAQEPRAELVRLDLHPPERQDTLAFTVAVRPVEGGDTVALAFEVGL
jgi:phage baseplate assembly protein W